jgi:outer membrane receptor protein involved in Fe transport
MNTALFRKNALALAIAVAGLSAGVAMTAQAADAGAGQTTTQKASKKAPNPKKSVNLQQVTITASPGNFTKMSSSISVSSLDPMQIQQSGAQSASDILREIPGIRAESSGGDGNANIAVRGLPVASGGGKFVQFQINGMPVLEFGDIAFATPDTFLRTDLNLKRIEVVRGGSASVFASNAPGAVFNFITKTGETKGGDVRLTTGLNYDSKRLDFDYGQPISATTRFHVGGYLRSGQGAKNINYTAEEGGQVMGNITHDIDGGYLRASFQWLNDKAPVYLPVPVSITGSNSNPHVSSLPGFDVRNGAMQSPYFLRDLAVNAQGNPIVTNIADGYHSKVKAFGGEGLFTLGDDWKLHEQFRIASNSGTFVGPYPAEVNTAAALAQEIGGAGATLGYATGPNAGQMIANPSTVGGNGLATRVHLFNVSLPNMDNATNNLTLKRTFQLDNGPLDLLFGYYHSIQNIKQDWHWNTYLETVQGKNAQLLDVYDSNGNPLTDHGLVAYGTPYWGNCCVRSYDVKYTMDAPFISTTWEPGNWRIDAGLRFDRIRANGTYAAGINAPMDVNRDGTISVPEQSVAIVDNAHPMPVNYTKHHVEYSLGVNYAFNLNLAVFARASRGARFNADRLLFGGGLNADGNAPQGVAVNEVKQYEGGVKWSTRHISLFATGFYATTQEQNQDVTSTVSTLISRKYRAHGLELEGSYNNGGFALRAGVTYTHSRIVADAITPADVGDTPQRQATWVYQVSPSYMWGPFTVGASAIGTTKSYASNPNGLVMPGYTQVNLFARYAVTPKMDLSLHVDNAFNTIGLTEIDQSPVNVTSNGLNSARSIIGRTVYASWQYSF